MATPVEKQRAAQLVDAFAKRTVPVAFTKIPRDVVANQLQARILTPSLISQGHAGLCPSASLVYPLALASPEKYVRTVIDLYEQGKATINKWELKPCADLKHYALPGPDKEGIPPPAAADWVIMASIRDSENWFFDYESTQDSGAPRPGELANWLRKAGYTNVLDKMNSVFNKDVANLRMASTYHEVDYHVILALDADLLKGKKHRFHRMNHFVVLASPVTFGHEMDPQPGGAKKHETVAMKIFTWGSLQDIPSPGQAHVSRQGNLYLSDFLDHYYGFIACKF